MNKQNIFLSIVSLVIGVALGVFLANAERARAPSVVSLTETKTFALLIKERKLIEGEADMSVKEGDTVSINIIVDENEELHLHGYDKSIELEKGKQGTLSFVASTTGRYPFELEKSKTELGAVNVYPR